MRTSRQIPDDIVGCYMPAEMKTLIGQGQGQGSIAESCDAYEGGNRVFF